MKKAVLLFALALLVGAIQAQVTLRYKTHGLFSDVNNEMKLVEYQKPGNSGSAQIWDFSGLQFKKEFEGTVEDAALNQHSYKFPQSNVVLNEFGNQFYFDCNESYLKQYGYVSTSGRTAIVFDEPFIKLQFPFTYRNKVSGPYVGKYVINENTTADINGQYEVHADAYGKLILPSGIVLENTLRVKTTKEYTQTRENSNYQVKTTTYRWYIEEIRYPVLVLIENTIISNNRTSTSFQAAYREKIQTDLENIEKLQVEFKNNFAVFPNPVIDEMRISYQLPSDAMVKMSLYTTEGKPVAVLLNQQQTAGSYNPIMNIKRFKLNPGNYFLILETGTDTHKKRIAIVE